MKATKVTKAKRGRGEKAAAVETNEFGVLANVQDFPVGLPSAGYRAILHVGQAGGRWYHSLTFGRPADRGGTCTYAPATSGPPSESRAAAIGRALAELAGEIINALDGETDVATRLALKDCAAAVAGWMNRHEWELPDDSPAPDPTATDPGDRQTEAVPLAAIRKGTDNPRRDFDADGIAALAASLADLGQLQPVGVIRRTDRAGDGYEMIYGERRVRAARSLGWETIRAIVYSAGQVGESVRADLQLTENLLREQLNPMELAEAFGALEARGMTARQIATRYKLPASAVRRHLYLLRLCEPVRLLVASGRLPILQAELIARIGDEAGQISLAGRTIGEQWLGGNWGKLWRVRGDGPGDDRPRDFVLPAGQLRGDLQHKMRKLGGAGWPMGEPFADQRPCAGCPNNSATIPVLFAGVPLPSESAKGCCTEAPCYERKVDAWAKVRDLRKDAAAKARETKIAKARESGRFACDTCGRLADCPGADGDDHPEGWASATECGPCGEKREKRRQREARQHGTSAEARPFPAEPAEFLAVALHQYGAELSEAIADRLANTVTPDTDAVGGILRVCWAVQEPPWLNLRGGLIRLARRCEHAESLMMNGPELADLWRGTVGGWWEGQAPRYHPWDGAVCQVPLDVEAMGFLTFAEAFAIRLGMEWDRPRPTAETVAAERARAALAERIANGPLADAEAALAACEDPAILAELAAGKALRAKWRRAAVADRLAELGADSVAADAPPADDKKRKPRARRGRKAAEK